MMQQLEANMSMFVYHLFIYCCLRSSYQEGRVGIQLSRGEGWDPNIKRGAGLRSNYQEGSRVEIQLSKGEQG